MIEKIGTRLTEAWKKYRELFGEVPHGTEKQMTALLELAGGDDYFKDALDGQAALDEANNRIIELESREEGLKKARQSALDTLKAAEEERDTFQRRGEELCEEIGPLLVELGDAKKTLSEVEKDAKTRMGLLTTKLGWYETQVEELEAERDAAVEELASLRGLDPETPKNRTETP